MLIACSSTEGPAPLPVIAEIPAFEDINPDPHIVEVNLRASVTKVELEPGYQTTVMAYNDRIPGPLLHARVGDRVIVHFQNDLAEPTTIHWHGLRIPSDMDGSPMTQDPVPAGGSFTYDFVLPDPGTFWFHPHFQTIEQIDRGLYGAIVVAEKEKDAPKFTAERVFVLDDVRLDSAKQIAPYSYSGHDVMMGRLGNTLLVNGGTATITGIAPLRSVERWHLVSASTARVLDVSVAGASWRVIGTDGGLLPEPYTTSRVELAPGQRYDLEVIYNVDSPSVRLLAHVLDAQNREKALPLVEYTIEGDADATLPVYPAVTLPEIPVAPLAKEIRLGANNDGRRQHARRARHARAVHAGRAGDVHGRERDRAVSPVPLARAVLPDPLAQRSGVEGARAQGHRAPRLPREGHDPDLLRECRALDVPLPHPRACRERDDGRAPGRSGAVASVRPGSNHQQLIGPIMPSMRSIVDIAAAA
jgi:hypothetical protein